MIYKTTQEDFGRKKPDKLEILGARNCIFVGFFSSSITEWSAEKASNQEMPMGNAKKIPRKVCSSQSKTRERAA